jgi:hypothetical protein
MSKNGLILLTPTSVSVGSGSASIGTNGSVTFTGAHTVSLNGVFSADYDNYRIVTWHTSNNVTNGSLKFRLRVGGVDNSTSSSYVQQYLYVTTSTTLGGRITSTQAEINRYGNTYTSFVADFYGPYLTQPTAVRSITQGLSNTISTPVIYDCVATHSQSSAYDGFSFYTGYTPATLTGRIAVYGVRK